jgi:hypothetical protein
MSSDSVCQVARRWMDVGSFNTRIFIVFMIFRASVWNILNISLYCERGNLLHVCVSALMWSSSGNCYTKKISHTKKNNAQM